jgi:hypothetical protein
MRATPHGPNDARAPCPGCRTELPSAALYCFECGLCMLAVTSSGTVITASPWADADDEIDVEIELDEASLRADERLDTDLAELIDCLTVELGADTASPALQSMTVDRGPRKPLVPTRRYARPPQSGRLRTSQS